MRNVGEQPSPATASERRYLSIMFIDLVGFTDLSERLDPEDVLAVQHRYQHLALTIMERFGGFVGNYTGDGVLVYFGYPIAHGNDAERALRAGLEMIEQLRELEFILSDGSTQRVQARIGIHTGLAIVGRELMSAGDRLHGIVGAAVNLAARLQKEAPPGGVVVSQETRGLVAGQFDFIELGTRRLKGILPPIAMFLVVRAKPATKSDRSRLLPTPSTMIGRTFALTQLLTCWQAACTGSRGLVIEIVGDAGIGKTRLVGEFTLQPAVSGVPILQAHCHELFAQSPLYVVGSYLWRRAGLAVDDDHAARRRKFDGLLTELGLGSTENSRIIASFPGLAATQLVESIKPTPHLLKRAQFDLIKSAFSRIASGRPTILWVEDVHWLDPSSAELLREIAEAQKNAPFMILLTRRSFPRGPELPKTDATIHLEQLSREDGMALAKSVHGARNLSDADLMHAVEIAEGIPLFVEQLVRSLADDGASAPRRTGRAADLPLVLAEMVSERLDRQPGARQVLQAAACLGRSFNPRFLAALLKEQMQQIAEALESLVEAEILLPKRYGEEIRYEFRHALLQRMAYESMIEAERRAMHTRMAEFLGEESDIPTPPEMRAHHLTESRQFPEAIKGWIEAGMNAAKQSAHFEAINHLRKGLSLLDRIVDTRLRDELEINLQAALIGSVTVTQGPTSLEHSVCCERGLQLSRLLPRTPLVFAFLFGQFTFANCRGEVDDAWSLADAFLSLAEREQYHPGRVIGHRLRGMLFLGKGDAAGAREQLERSLSLYVPETDSAATHMFGQNTMVHSRSLLSLALFCVGDVENALRLGRDALRAADSLHHPHSTAIALAYVGGNVFGYCGATEQLVYEATRLVALSEQHNISSFGAHGTAFLGWGLAQRGELTEGISLLEKAIKIFDKMHYVLGVSAHLANLADVQRRAGRLSAAKTSSARAIEMMLVSGSGWADAEVLRVDALIEGDLSSDDPPRKADMLWHAAERAREMGTPVFERRCLLSLSEIAGDRRNDLQVSSRLSELAHLNALPEIVASFMAGVGAVTG